MKIADIQVYPLGYVREQPTPFTRSFALVKVTTDAGLHGWGEASDCFGHSNPLVIQQVVEEEMKRHLLGKDPLLLEQHLQAFRQWVYPTLGLAGAVTQALSAVDIALWDIRGQALGQPVSRLLGHYRDQVAVYAAGTIAFDRAPDWHAAFFEPLLQRGCTTVKLRLGRSLRWDTELVRSVRELLGDEIDIIADAKYNYTLPTAIRLAAALEACDVLYLEEPLPEYHLEAIAQLAAQTSLPLAYGEHTYTVHGFRELIDHDVAIFQPDATVVGGLHEARKVAALAEAWGRAVSPHCGGLSAVGIAANVHLSASTPTFTVLEYDATPTQPMRDLIVHGRPFSPERIVSGCLAAPAAPGLGVEVDEAALADFAYRPRSHKLDTPPSYATPHL